MSVAGGCTFPEDPQLDYTLAAPLWTADRNPCVLTVSAEAADRARGIDLSTYVARIARSTRYEHVRVVIAGEAFRLDVVSGNLADEQVQITYHIAQDGRLARQVETLQRFEASLHGEAPRDTDAAWLSRRLMALKAWDARNNGAALRDIATLLWGPEEWPGPGEYRKSAARRFVAMGEELMGAGPSPFLME